MYNECVISAVYILFSVLCQLSLYRLSVHFSGIRFDWKWSCVCLILVMFFGSFQLSIAKYGADSWFPALDPFISGNETVRWIALISALLHACCIPTGYEPRRWFKKR